MPDTLKVATCFFCSATTPLPYTPDTVKEWGHGIVFLRKRDDVECFDLCPIHKGRDQECLLHIIGGVQIAMPL